MFAVERRRRQCRSIAPAPRNDSVPHPKWSGRSTGCVLLGLVLVASVALVSSCSGPRAPVVAGTAPPPSSAQAQAPTAGASASAPPAPAALPVALPVALPEAPCELGPVCRRHFVFVQTHCATLLPRGCPSLADETASVMRALCDDKESSEEACATYTQALGQLLEAPGPLEPDAGAR